MLAWSEAVYMGTTGHSNDQEDMCVDDTVLKRLIPFLLLRRQISMNVFSVSERVVKFTCFYVQ